MSTAGRLACGYFPFSGISTYHKDYHKRHIVAADAAGVIMRRLKFPRGTCWHVLTVSRC